MINNSKPEDTVFASPQIMNIPSGAEKRLIDAGMLHYEASVAGYNERYRRGETSHTIHVWWARRPHSAMRALVFASVCRNTSLKAVDLMARLAVNNDADAIAEAAEMIKEGYCEPPKVLDMFGGGGTIPFEAKKMGLDTYSIDANEMSVFIQKCNMVYSDGMDINEAGKIIEDSGRKILNELKEETRWLFPLREKYGEDVFGYLWTYSMQCEECGYRFYLAKRPWLTKKKGKRLSFVLVNEDEGQKIDIREVGPDYTFPSNWIYHAGHSVCPKCGRRHEKVSIRNCEDTLVAVISGKRGVGKSFYTVEEKAVPGIPEMGAKEKELLDSMDFKLPASELPRWSGIVNPALYGIETHADFLNRRQRLVLLYLIRILRDEYKRLVSKYEPAMARFATGVLSSLIDQVVDWNCRLSMWIPQNEQVGRAFCGPGVAMLWDYAETDQVLKGPANLWDKLDRIIKGVRTFECSKGKVSVQKAPAQELPFEDKYFDAIVTDPPYYDNIYYSILADFFYAWKKGVLEVIEPELFGSDKTDYEYELVASSVRNESAEKAHEKYCNELEKAFCEAARVLKDNGVFSFIYSHSSVNGWDAVVHAYRKSPFVITSIQPLSIERKGRPRAVLSEAVNTCMAFVARKTAEDKKEICFRDIMEKTINIIDVFGMQLMNKSGWNESDAAMATLAYSVGMIANAKKVNGVKDDKEAIIRLSKLIMDYFPSFNIKIRDSL